MHNKTALLAALVSGIAATAPAADLPDITPYRPSVSNPAQLPAPGQLELEIGGLHSRTGTRSDDSLPYLFKLAFNPQWGILVGGDAYVATTGDNGDRLHGLGDTSIVLKHAMPFDDATAFGIEFGAKLPTARQGIGSGSADYTINGIASRDAGILHLDVNLNTTRIGAPDPGASRWQTGLAASLSASLSDRWGVTAEWSGTRQPGSASAAQLLGAVTYSPNKRLTFDAGMIKGMNPASPDRAVFAGVVVPLANFW